MAIFENPYEPAENEKINRTPRPSKNKTVYRYEERGSG